MGIYRSLALWVALTCVSCAVEPNPIDPLPFGECLCEQASCPVSVCDIELELDPLTCSNEVSAVEVLVGKQLENHIWAPGDKVRTCTTIPRGESRPLYARADTPWQWSEDIACPAPDGSPETAGPTIVRILQCTTTP